MKLMFDFGIGFRDLQSGPGSGPGTKILIFTGTGTKNFLPGLDRDQKKVILQIPNSYKGLSIEIRN
jgi:hypothetical protein